MFICLVQDKSEEMVMSRYLTLSKISSLNPFSEGAGTGCQNTMALGFKVVHFPSASTSCCKS